MPQKTAHSFQHCRGSKKDVILGKKRRRRNSPYHSSFLLRPQSPHNSTAGQQPRIMIRQHKLFCKLFSTKISTKGICAEDAAFWECGTMVCPVCASRRNCVPHGGYTRSLIEYEGGKVVYGRVQIRRVRCGSCGHTHAILPDHIVPYSTYSLQFILQVLAEYFLGLRTVEQLCRRYAISASMLYQWKALFL